MAYLKELDERITSFADSISREIAEKRFYEIEDVTAIAKTRLYLAISDCLGIEITNTELQRRTLISELADSKNVGRLSSIRTQLSKVNAKLKDQKATRRLCVDMNEYAGLKQYCYEKFGRDCLTEYFAKVEEVTTQRP